jgi:hypothetical protein
MDPEVKKAPDPGSRIRIRNTLPGIIVFMCLGTVNNHPAGPRMGCRAGIKSGAAAQQPGTLIVELRSTRCADHRLFLLVWTSAKMLNTGTNFHFILFVLGNCYDVFLSFYSQVLYYNFNI